MNHQHGTRNLVSLNIQQSQKPISLNQSTQVRWNYPAAMNPISQCRPQTNHPVQSHHDIPRTFCQSRLDQTYLTKERLSSTRLNAKVPFQITLAPAFFLGLISFFNVIPVRSSTLTYGFNLLISFNPSGQGKPVAPIIFISHKIRRTTHE